MKKDLLEFKEKVEKIEDIKEKDFRTFIDNNYLFQGCEVGYYLSPNLCSGGFEIYSTTLEIFNIYKETKKEDFNELVETYGQENIDKYEEKLEKDFNDTLYNHGYYPAKLYEECEIDINNILDNFYQYNEDEIDNKILFEVRDYIKEETLKLIEEELEELEELEEEM